MTPAHDPNDFAIGQRHALPSLNILDETARVALPGSPYDGMDRYAAREKIVEDLRERGLLVDVKEHTLAIGVSQRSGVVIEPRLSQQWFLAVNRQPNTGGNTIAQNAIDAVRNGHIRFTPEMYAKTYFEWMTNIHDWCISRQLWWGHQIPAWHCGKCKEITVARETPTACEQCGSGDLTQETDVLDTWFSSGLLPFTVFGWPNADGEGRPTLTPDLEAFYPTQLLVTGFDILFFWVARMIMLGCHFTLDVPMADGSKRELADAVPFREGLYSRAGARCGATEDVEDEGKCDRPDRHHQQVWDGRGAVYAGQYGVAGHGHCVQRRANGWLQGVRRTRYGMRRDSCL